jgi:hypothetical protein
MTPRAFLFVSLLLAPLSAQNGSGWFVADQHLDRKLTRVAYFSQTGSPGQYAIDYGAPEWKDSYEADADKLKGKRGRLGKDFFTRLDTSMELTIGGTKVGVGDYYLAIGRAENGDWKLVLYPAAELRKMHADAFLSGRLPATLGIEVPLTYAKVDAKAQQLHIGLKADKQKVGDATLTLHWGNHQLTAPIVADVGKPPAPPKKDDGKGR